MRSRTEQLREDARFKALRLLEKDPQISQRDIALALGVSLGATNYLLRALVERGLVKLARFQASDDKRRYAYVLTPKGVSEKAAITGRFLARKRREYEALRAEIDELSAEILLEDAGSRMPKSAMPNTDASPDGG